MARRHAGLLAAALLVSGCTEADYKGASFPPEDGPPRSSVLLLYLFRPEGKGVPWGDAAFYHRESPAALGAVPVEYRASLDGRPSSPAGERGDWVQRIGEGTHGLRVELEDRTVLYPFETGEDRSQIALWSLEDGGHVLGVRGNYPRTDLTSWPVDELSRTLQRFRLFVAALDQALARGTAADFERILTEDFRDPLGTRKDFTRAAVHEQAQGTPWRIVGDGWLDRESSRFVAHLVMTREGRRTYPSLELTEAPLGPGRFQVRSWY